MGVAGAGVEAGVAAEVAVPTKPLVLRRPPGRHRSELLLSQLSLNALPVWQRSLYGQSSPVASRYCGARGGLSDRPSCN